MAEVAPPKVFISYSHDSLEHGERVLALADRLRQDGIDASLDQYVASPAEGWPHWSEAGVIKADHVLMVCTETYLRRVDHAEEPGIGHGVLYEARIIRELLARSGSTSHKFVPILLSDGSDAHVPIMVGGATIHRGETEEGYEALYRLLTGQPAVPKPDLGQLRALPPRPRQSAGAPPAAQLEDIGVGGSRISTARSGSRRFAGRMFRLSRAIIFSAGVAMAATIGIAGLPMWHQHPLLSTRASIMVLPFRNLNGPDEDYFADAVTDALTTDLSRLSDTMVIARATAFTYKGKAVDVRQFRREFGVRYILAGSIQRIGTRVQANAELIDTSSTSSVWAERFQSELTDPFELQEAVTSRIGASLHLQLVRAENRRAIAERTTDPDAYDLRLHAMAYVIDKLTPENTLAARRELEKSVALDPNSAEAWSELADVLMIDFLRSWNNATREVVAQAEEALRKAYAIDRSVALAHLVEGKIRRVKGDHQGALDAFDEALQLDPNLATAYAQKANELVFLGRAKEVPALVTKAIDLSPRDPDLDMFYYTMGRGYFTMAAASGTPPEAVAKDYDHAIHWLQKVVQENHNYVYPRIYLISAYALTGRLGQPEAQAALHEYREKFNNWPLEPRIKDYYSQVKYRDAHPAFRATIQEMLRGLQISKETAGFP